LTKSDLVDEVAKRCELTKPEAEDVVQTILDSVVCALNDGEKVELRGFGSFRLRAKRARRGRNPKSSEQVHIPAKKVAYFKPGKMLRELINS
jgi:integration host factor subunit beta